MKQHNPLNAQPHILLIYTGGTIGMIQDLETHALKPLNFDHIHAHVPELNRLDVKIESIAFEEPIDSTDVKIDTWQRLVSIIDKHYTKFDGFVILHGSDTMSYTASALSFMLEGLNKPIILTGSQLPIGVTRTDGKENLITAIEIASAHKRGEICVPEVCVYFEYQLLRGNRTHKYSAEHFDAFKSPNYPQLANAGVSINYNIPYIRKYDGRDFIARDQLNSNIAILHLFPGISDDTILSFLKIESLDGLILHTFGSGNIPNNNTLTTCIKTLLDKNVMVYNITQCNAGYVNRSKYATNPGLLDTEIVDGADITLEAGITKLMYVLGLGLSYKEAKYHLKQNLRGEIS